MNIKKLINFRVKKPYIKMHPIKKKLQVSTKVGTGYKFSDNITIDENGNIIKTNS